MKFCEYRTNWDGLRRAGGDELLSRSLVWAKQIAEKVGRREQVDANDAQFGSIMSVEGGWIGGKRPYYNVWPTVVPMLLRLKLDFPSIKLKMPGDLVSLCLRFPEPNEHMPGVRAVLVSSVLEQRYNTNGFMVMIDRGEILGDVAREKGVDPNPLALLLPVHDYFCFPLIDESVDALMQRCPVRYFGATAMDAELFRQVTSLICAICLIDQGNTDLLTPDVLADDDPAYREAVRKFDESRKAVIEARAFRRRGPGWDLGLAYEQSEHGPTYVVPPHPQRYWVGKGRTEVKILVRKGYVVNRDGATTIPTGYEDGE